MKRFMPYFMPALAMLIAAGCNNNKTQTKSTETPVVLAASSTSNAARESFNRGLAMLDQNDAQNARTFFQKAIQQDPKLAIAYMFKGNTDLSAKEFADDMKKAKENLATANEWEKLYYDYNETFLNNDWNKRLELAQKMVTLYPNTARAQQELGNTYLAGAQDAKAREAFEKAVALEPKWVGGYANLVQSYMFSEPRDFKKAEQNALKAVELAPTSAGAEIALGDTYRAQNDLEKAREAYSKAISIDPASPVAYYKKGHANSFLGHFEEARQNYTDGAAHDQAVGGAIANVANTWLYAGDYKSALQYLSEEVKKLDAATASKDQITAAKMNAMNSCANIATHIADSKTLNAVCAMMDPLSQEIGNDLGTAEGKLTQKGNMLYWYAMTAAIQNDLPTALAKAEELKTTLEPVKDPNKLNPYEFIQGYVSMKQKKYADAIAHFEKSNPSVFVYNRYWLAMANEAAGNKDKATELYKDIAVYNFSDVGYALIRNDAIRKAK
jgi:tetratricopeptide (TPR) repeat protein